MWLSIVGADLGHLPASLLSLRGEPVVAVADVAAVVPTRVARLALLSLSAAAAAAGCCCCCCYVAVAAALSVAVAAALLLLLLLISHLLLLHDAAAAMMMMMMMLLLLMLLLLLLCCCCCCFECCCCCCFAAAAAVLGLCSKFTHTLPFSRSGNVALLPLRSRPRVIVGLMDICWQLLCLRGVRGVRGRPFMRHK